MVFSSIEFLLYFLPVFFILYGFTPNRFKNVTLMAGSLVFYAMGEPKYLVLLMCSILVNYFVALYLGSDGKKGRHKKQKQTKSTNDNKRKMLLITAIIGNVGVLLFFKAESDTIGLPLGISFYSFQMISFLIDVFQHKIQREPSFFKLATYITMFPKLLSGPIADYGEVERELTNRSFSVENVQSGLQLFTVGLAAKVLLADRVGILWHEVQVAGFESISTALSWIAAYAYSMKIYFDFWGYSLMAMGLGRMLGFTLPANFRTPYMARSVRDFYRRWHITLGRWFCRYVYIPLGGSRRGELRTIGNLMTVWLLTALWHGITLNYLLWGLMLCTCIIIERFVERTGITKYMTVFPHLYLWCVIPVSWMCFAITDVEQLQIYLSRMFHMTEGIHVQSNDWMNALGTYGGLLVAAVFFCTPLAETIYRRIKEHFIGKVLFAVLFWVCVQRVIREGNNPFMYFSY